MNYNNLGRQSTSTKNIIWSIIGFAAVIVSLFVYSALK